MTNDEIDNAAANAIIHSGDASSSSISVVLHSLIGDPDGRSKWKWFCTLEGDWIFGCYPRGATYEVTEKDRESIIL